MDTDNRKWLEEALAMIENATRRNAVILFVRHRVTDESDAEAEVVLTNATTPDVIRELVNAVLPASEGGGE